MSTCLLRLFRTFVLICAFSFAPTSWGRQPNVIVIITDDQGYGDLSITGNTIVETPHMDRLATEGAWLDQFYVSPVCTPTRATLMTGRYNYRTRAIDTFKGRAVMEPEEVTLAETLKEAGYATGIFGKWHLGDYYPTRAIDQGFDEAVVHQGGGLRQPSNPPEGDRYHDPILFHNGEPKRYEGYCTDIYFDEAARFIEEKAKGEAPFFAYIATNAPHGPFDEPPTRDLYEEYLAKFPGDKRAATKAAFYSMIKNVDDNMGRLAEKLNELEIDEETLVVFLTDNGPAGGGSAGPYRGAKASVYNGGIRTVCFWRWPGTIDPGSKAFQTTAHIDLMPTILDFCEVKPPEGVTFDGRSVRPLMAEKGVMKIQGWEDRHLFFQWHRGDEPVLYHHFAVVGPQGQWKLLNNSSKSGREALDTDPDFQLYDLRADLGETMNIASQHPEKVEQLKGAYESWLKEVGNSRSPNYGMPPIVLGAEQAPVVVLTRQDRRSEILNDAGWGTVGFWPVSVSAEGPYTVQIRLEDDAEEATEVELSLSIGDSTWKEAMTIPRGVKTMAMGEVSFPVTGIGEFRAQPVGAEKAAVYQVTIIR